MGPIVPPASSGGPGPRPPVSTPEHTLFHEEGTCAAKTEPLCGDIETAGFLLTPGKTGQKNTRFQKLRASCLHSESGGRRVAEGARGWGRRAAATSLVRTRPMACAPGPPAEFPQCPPSCADGVESLGPRAGLRATGRRERSGRPVGVRPAGGRQGLPRGAVPAGPGAGRAAAGTWPGGSRPAQLRINACREICLTPKPAVFLC